MIILLIAFIIAVIMFIGTLAQFVSSIANNIILLVLFLLSLILINVRKINIVKIILTFLVTIGLIYLRINPNSEFLLIIGPLILLIIQIIIIISIIEIIDRNVSPEELEKRKQKRKKAIIKGMIQIGTVILIIAGLVLAFQIKTTIIKILLFIIVFALVIFIFASALDDTLIIYGIKEEKENKEKTIGNQEKELNNKE